MTLWFGPFVDMRPDYGYFHLCPTCYQRYVKPHLDQVQGRLAELHPLAHHLGLTHNGSNAEDDPGDTVAAGGSQDTADENVEERGAERTDSPSSRS